MAANRDEWETETDVARKSRRGEWDALLALTKDEEKSSREQAKSFVPAALLAEKLILLEKVAPAEEGAAAAEARRGRLEDLRQLRAHIAQRLRVLVVANKCGWDTVTIMENNAKTGDDKAVQQAYDEAKKIRAAAKAEKAKSSRKDKPYGKRSASSGSGSSSSSSSSSGVLQQLLQLQQLTQGSSGNNNNNNNNNLLANILGIGNNGNGGNNNGRSNSGCYNCGKFGHLARNCHQNKK